MTRRPHFKKNRRAISQIMGSLFMLAIVVPMGTVVVTKGLNEVGEISNRLSSSITYQNEGVREDIVFEHIRFEPAGNQMTISLRNTGTVDLTITKVTMVKTDTQDLIINNNTMAVDAQPNVGTNILLSGNLQFSQRWDDPNYVNSKYEISILTSKGNFFGTVARPFNT
ncbi:MAG: hypothetical protein EPO62_02950 [Candidatus Nitrosotenuis sp.]|nr:MAG: hypothetical protein EPO62_02950 [Candidatus Nitrosotenuis sp.]